VLAISFLPCKRPFKDLTIRSVETCPAKGRDDGVSEGLAGPLRPAYARPASGQPIMVEDQASSRKREKAICGSRPQALAQAMNSVKSTRLFATSQL